MCFYFRQSKDALTVANRFRAQFKEDTQGISFEVVNGFAHPKCPVITDANPSLIESYVWGLVPHFAPDVSIWKYTLNARIETVDIKPSFRKSIGNRCLVISDGFYEWKEEIVNGKKFKQRYLISLYDQQLFSFAGIYSSWNNPFGGEKLDTFTILTTKANDLVASIHSKNRMPVILSPEQEKHWLSGSSHSLFAQPTNLQLQATKSTP